MIRPEIESVLKEVGLLKERKEETPKELKEQLNDAGLNLDKTLETVGWLMENGASDIIKLRAAEDALRVHGLMKDQPAAAPVINIIIKDESALAQEVNPILIPREVQLH